MIDRKYRNPPTQRAFFSKQRTQNVIATFLIKLCQVSFPNFRTKMRLQMKNKALPELASRSFTKEEKADKQV